MPHLELVSFKTGQQISKPGESIEVIYFPETLVVSQLYYLEDGSSAGTAVIGLDGLLGATALAGSTQAKCWSIASIGGTARRIRVERLRAEYENNVTFQKLFLTYLSERLFQVSQKLVCSARHHLEERLSTWLLMLLDRANSSTLPVTHEVIALHLGVRRAGVTKFCNVLRDQGVVSNVRGKLTILDRESLERFACECYKRLKLSPNDKLSAEHHQSANEQSRLLGSFANVTDRPPFFFP